MKNNELALVKKDVVDVVSGKVMEFQKPASLASHITTAPKML